MKEKKKKWRRKYLRRWGECKNVTTVNKLNKNEKVIKREKEGETVLRLEG